MRTKDNRKKPPHYIPVSEFAKTIISRRGYSVSVGYIYRLIKDNKIDRYGVKVVEHGKEIFLTKL
jgi:hypothetical protein